MTSTNPLEIGETLAYQTPNARFTVRLQYVRADTYSVTVERGGFRVDELCRTFATESEARDLARTISEMLRDGATVTEVVAAIQPAADVITAATALLELAAAVRKLSDAQRAAITTADHAGHITRDQVATVKTLYALESLHLGMCARQGYRITGFTLNTRGLAMRDHIRTCTVTAAA